VVSRIFGSNSAMTRLKKLTISYSAPEDRLHLAFQIENGPALRMWLTQRLARQLVLLLREQISKLAAPSDLRSRQTAPGVAEADAPASRPRDSGATDNNEPVAVRNDAPAWLIRNIVVTVGSDKLRLQFESDLDIVPTTVINRRSAAHWLERLRKYFIIADWPLDLWPADHRAAMALPRSDTKRH
jgi:hypothetical protein